MGAKDTEETECHVSVTQSGHGPIIYMQHDCHYINLDTFLLVTVSHFSLSTCIINLQGPHFSAHYSNFQLPSSFISFHFIQIITDCTYSVFVFCLCLISSSTAKWRSSATSVIKKKPPFSALQTRLPCVMPVTTVSIMPTNSLENTSGSLFFNLLRNNSPSVTFVRYT